MFRITSSMELRDPVATQGWKALVALGSIVWAIVARKRFRATWYVMKTGRHRESPDEHEAGKHS